MNNSPKNIGPYTIEAELGRGGMGIVYQATDSRLGRQVAIKSLHDRIAVDGENVARFMREARALAALNHTNVAGIHGLEQDGDQHFLVLEYVAGETLAQRLQRGPMPVDEALETCIQIAAGLEAAHEAGVVHRDLKPANVKITPDGQVKVLDFGLALMTPPQTATETTDETLPITASDPATMAGTLLGTVPYMSPEQARGEVVDKRSDIWSWAVITLECLSGSNPFAGATMSDTIAAILTAEIDLDNLPPSTPALVLPLLRRCLDRNARTRLRDAGDLHRLLQDCRHEVSRAAVGGSAPAAIVDKTLLIDDETCRALDKEGFDPRLIGWPMQYADNERNSRVLQVWVPSFGEDHSMKAWRELLSASPYRTVVATPIGLEPHAEYRPQISMNNQLMLLRRLVAVVAAETKPDKVIIAGFS